MTALRAKEEAALAKILTPKQLTRLMQITTQKDGPQALIRPDVIQKISIDEDQVTAITEVLSGLQTQQRELRRAEMDQLPKGPSGRPDFQQVEEWRGTKEGQEQAKKAQASQDKLKSQTMKQIAKILYKPQQTAFNKLLGAPFDLSKLQNNGFGGPGGRNRNGNNAATPTATAKAATSKNVKSPGNSAGGRSTKAQVQADDDEEETPAPAAAAKKSSRPTPKASTRSSLRANRGLPDPEN